MPGWRDVTEPFERSGRVKVLSLVEEQHPERTRLFMQWKQLDWPTMVDSLNLLGVNAVPITLLVDEYGIIRSIGPNEAEFRAFLETTFPSPAIASAEPSALTPANANSAPGRRVEELLQAGDAAFLRGGAGALEAAISSYEAVLERDAGNSVAHFRLGVACRARYETSARQSSDFERAIHHWFRALELDPNQYIWRRRIQQFGPRLDKPYSFYDWVNLARQEISARGEIPVPLAVEPAGAEFAYPAEAFEQAGAREEEPDPGRRITPDTKRLILSHSVVVPATANGERALRAHLSFEPNPTVRAHWNNEAGNMLVWVSPPDGFQIDRRLHEFQVPSSEVSQERRQFEVEFRSPEPVRASATANGYALCYVCEDVKGTCLYRRVDFTIPLPRLD